MDKNIFDFLKVINVKNMLIISSEDISNYNNEHPNITQVKTNNLNKIKEIMNETRFDLIFVDDNLSVNLEGFLKLLNENYENIPLIVLNKNFLDENTQYLLKYDLQANPLINDEYIIYNFKRLDALLDNNKNTSLQIDENLDKIYELNYQDNSSKFYPLKILLNSNKIGGLKNVPLIIKGYKSLNDDNNLDIGYYLRRYDIKNCEDVRLHFILNAKNNNFNPNSIFTRENYLAVNPDLKNIAYDPYLHYILLGKNEKRDINNISGEFQSSIINDVIKGWIAQINNDNPLNAYINIDTQNYPIIADIYREDLEKHHINKGKHGFEFEIPTEYQDGQKHTVTLNYGEKEISEFIYSARYKIYKSGSPIRIIKGVFQSSIEDSVVKGWIAEIGNNDPVNAYIEIEGKKYNITANIYREDLEKHHINKGNHGFEFEIPSEYQDGYPHTITLNYENNTVAEIIYNFFEKIIEEYEPIIKGAFQSKIKDTLVKGWVAEIGNNYPVDSYIKIEGKKYKINANIFREDLKRNKINNGNHGFEFNIPEEFIDGKKHLLELYGPNDKKLSQISHVFTKDNFENNFERYFSISMTSPEIILPATEQRKKILAMMNNIAKYLVNQVNNEELVSIIMPTYNRESLIDKSIQSVLNQSYKNFELIIIDDYSTDNTVKKIEEFEDDRIHLIRNSSNMGVSKSRNIGLKESKGKYIMYLDSDNDWEKDYIKATVGAFTLLNDADAVYSGQYVYENDRTNLKYIRYGTINKGLIKNRNYIDLNCFSHTRDIYEREGGFDEKLNRFVDWDLSLKYMTYGKVYSVPFILSNYYINITENAISNKTQYLEQQEQVFNKQQERLKNKKYDFNITRGVSVIIPSYESLPDLKDCLESIFNLKAPWIEIIVVDNNSSENVIRYLVKLKNEGKIKLILNKENLGFTYAVNQGIEISDINNDILLLNNDAVVTEYAIQLLQKAAYELDDCGITVPQQILPANTKTINVHVPYANNDVECDVNLSNHHKNIINVPLFHNGEYTELSFAPFFCVYIKRDTYNESLGLDAELGRHFRSDMLYCNYVRTVLNKKIYHVSESRVYHKLQKATLTLKENSSAEHDLLYVKNRWSNEEQKKYGFQRAKWDF